jgi:hypothetical protein
MGSSRHRGHGLHGVGFGHGATRPDRRAGWYVRRVRAEAGTIDPARAGVPRRIPLIACLLVGAALQALGAQDTTRVRRDTTIKIPAPPHADSIMRRDSLARLDSLRRRDSLARRDSIVRADTARAPLAHAESPPAFGIASTMRWNRAELFATGALTVQDLLDRVVGVTPLRSGWIAAPAVAAYLGDVRRVRVYYDGVERDELDPRAGGALDLSQINLWSIEDAAIEQGPGEIRVHLRSWRVTNTNPSTRTDISTGDQQTNLFRGFFGRRYQRGEVLQVAAQEYGTTPPLRFGSSSDQIGGVARVGWARGPWSADLFANLVSRHRGVITASEGSSDSIPSVDSKRTDAYLRAAFGDPDMSAAWVQVLASLGRYEYTGIRTLLPADSLAVPDSELASLDTSTFRSQYVLSAGLSRMGGRVSATERWRAGAGAKLATLALRGSYAFGPFAVSARYEGKGVDSISHSDVVAQAAPLSFVALIAGAGRSSDERVKDSTSTTGYLRGEIGLRLRGLWFVGGIVRRDSARLAPPRIFDTSFTRRSEESVSGVTAAIRGRLWGPLYVNAWGVRWSDSLGVYRPRYQTRSELYVSTNLIERFPSGNFGLLASIIHEYRSNSHFPVGSAGLVRVSGYRTYSTQLEIRIADAVVSWQFRNFLGERYTQVPGFNAPRQTSFYGVRWQFWN